MLIFDRTVSHYFFIHLLTGRLTKSLVYTETTMDMSPRTTQQFEEIRDQKKKLIMDTAMHLFASEGFYKTSISEIARKAGISKGLMYNYFESKDDLLLRIVTEGMEEMFGLFDTNQDGELSKEELLGFIDQSCRLLKSRTLYWKLYFSIVAQPQVLSMFGTRFMEMLQPFWELVRKYFQKMGAGNPDAEAVLLYSILDGLAFNYVQNPGNFPLDEIREILIKRYAKI